MFSELTNRVGSGEFHVDEKCDLYTVHSTVEDCINGMSEERRNACVIEMMKHFGMQPNGREIIERGDTKNI